MSGTWKTRESPFAVVGIIHLYEIHSSDLHCCDERHRRISKRGVCFQERGASALAFPLRCLARHTKETVGRMKNTEGIDQLICRRWPELKKKAQNEDNPDKLMAIVEEIDALLFIIEMRIAGRSRPMGATETNSRSLQRELTVIPSDD